MLASHFNGSKKPKIVSRRAKDKDLKDATLLLPSARRLFARPNYMPTEPKEIDELAMELIDWSQQEDSHSIDKFFGKKCMSPSRFMRAAKEFEILADAFEIALTNIASRLQDLIKDNQLYLINKEKQYSLLSREEARLKREADLEQRVITTYKEEIIGIPVFTAKDKA